MTNQFWLDNLANVEVGDATYKPQDTPLVLKGAKGSMIWDVEDRSYIDMCAGFGALPFGHNPDFILEVLAQQKERPVPLIEHGMGDVYPSASKVRLLEKIREFLPQYFEMGALALTGGQAVEIALKTAMLSTGKSGIICFEGSYHGLDLGVLPTTSRSDFRNPFRKWLCETNVRHVPFGCGRKELELARGEMESVAAILVEPIQGRAGIIAPPYGWLEMVKDWCQEHGVLLIFDEVFVGFGRTGRDFFSAEIHCDIVCLGKALGCGYPVSACFGTAKAMKSWPQSRGEALHTGTFYGHPLICEIAYRGLVKLQETQLMKDVKLKSDKLRRMLHDLFCKDKTYQGVRGEGLMLGAVFCESGRAVRWMDNLRRHGVISLPSGELGNVLSFTPALNFEDFSHFYERASLAVQRFNNL